MSQEGGTIRAEKMGATFQGHTKQHLLRRGKRGIDEGEAPVPKKKGRQISV